MTIEEKIARNDGQLYGYFRGRVDYYEKWYGLDVAVIMAKAEASGLALAMDMSLKAGF